MANATSNGTLNLAATNGSSGGVFTGSTSINFDDTFSATLTNTSGGGIATVTGTTFSNHIQMSMSGSLATASMVDATFAGTTNPLAATYSGTISGGTEGSGKTLSLHVATSNSSNVTGTIMTVGGPLSVTGTVSPIGIFTATKRSI